MTRTQSALREHEKQMLCTYAVAGLICAQRGMRLALKRIASGQIKEGKEAIEAALSSADRALADMEKTSPGASSMREVG
jgi:hypothetical protein